MFIKRCSLDCTISIVCVPYLIGYWADCITLYLYLTIVMLYGHLHLFSFLEDLNVFNLNFVHWFLPYKGFSCCTLAECRRFHAAVVVYRTLHWLSTLYLADTFRYATAVTFHNGRNNHPLFVPRVRTSYGKNSFYYKGIWNSLNASIYAATSLAQFKQLYKSIFS